MKELVVNKSQITSDTGEAEAAPKKKMSIAGLVALTSSALAAFTALNTTDLSEIFKKTVGVVGNPTVACGVIAAYVLFGAVANDN